PDHPAGTALSRTDPAPESFAFRRTAEVEQGGHEPRHRVASTRRSLHVPLVDTRRLTGRRGDRRGRNDGEGRRRRAWGRDAGWLDRRWGGAGARQRLQRTHVGGRRRRSGGSDVALAGRDRPVGPGFVIGGGRRWTGRSV